MDWVLPFKDMGAAAAASNPGWTFKHENVKDEWYFEYPKLGASGYTVSVRFNSARMGIFTDTGFHNVYGDPSDQTRDGLTGCVRDMLSADMRVREIRAGGKAYRWQLEHAADGTWRPEHYVVNVFWNYLGRRSQHIFKNHHLPSRARMFPDSKALWIRILMDSHLPPSNV